MKSKEYFKIIKIPFVVSLILYLFFSLIGGSLIAAVVFVWVGYTMRKKYSWPFKDIALGGFYLGLLVSLIIETIRLIASFFIYQQQIMEYNAFAGPYSSEIAYLILLIFILFIWAIIGTIATVVGGVISETAPSNKK